MCATVENYLPATTSAGAHFTLWYADGGRERISPVALDISPEPEAYTLRIAVRRPAVTTTGADSDTVRTNCGVCAAVISNVPSTLNGLTTADDPRHPAEADTTPSIPDPPLGGNPARSSVEDATADAVPIYLATKHAAYAPAKWRLFYLYTRRHYVDECLARTPTTLADAVQHHSAVSRHVLFHLFRP